MNKYGPEFLPSYHKEGITAKTLQKSIEKHDILEAQVIGCDVNNTLTVKISNTIIGEIPFDELEYHYNETVPTKIAAATTKVGKHIKFVPTSFERLENGNLLVQCSRKEAQQQCFDKFIKTLRPGDIIDARVTKIVNYGIFCDIGCGYIAMLPTNNISVTHIINPCESLKYVHKLRVVVKEIDENYMIQLSHKELLGTWEEEVEELHEGDIVVGAVISVENYGVFVRLSQNLSGLAEIPVDEDVKQGDLVTVRISSIKKDNMKIKLLILNKVSGDNPDNEDENVERMSFKYRDMNATHIDEWTYSTPGSKKLIATSFN
jgi:small subunit ribosomal protein S1